MELDIVFRRNGLGGVMDMTLAQVRLYSSALAKLEKERLKSMAIAARAGAADEKGWKSWLNALK